MKKIVILIALAVSLAVYAEDSIPAVDTLQVDTLVTTLDTCPYPVLLCGDFNDIPLSYACFSILAAGERMHDTFMERGKGSGRTYSIMGVDFRIDYIMHSNLFKCLRHKVLDFNIANDHYPVVADFKR